FKD
ncbi:hypothetical protein AT2G21105, partial [Arabidopsis thaliana]